MPPETPMLHPYPLPEALAHGRVAVITGAASGIGLATAKALALAGMRIVLADRNGDRLHDALQQVAKLASGGPEDAIAIPTDVVDPEALIHLADEAYAQFGEVSFLMNNAGIGANPGKPWQNVKEWRALLDVNFWGAVNGVAAFAERMIVDGRPGIIVNTGSKQGITTPPGNYAYNVSKSALKTYTEGLAHELRTGQGSVTAHLLIPGFTFTGLTTGATEKPAAAWTPDQVVEFMLKSLSQGDFYILCPDNETPRATDEKRMQWAVADIIANRPALSRWHPEWKEAFARYMNSGPSQT